MITKQQLARQRNWFKFRLVGCYIPINNEFVTEEERITINAINNLRTQLITNFDKCSKELGLRVPEHKCWCGKEAKIQIKDYNDILIWVCNKHKEL